ncbi:MAG: hypothetical protein JOY72_04195 [Actinobacteria bacterium]|nr:hypothetical protein [Actinomycetota bacterium]
MRPFIADATLGFSYGLIEMLDSEGRPTGVNGGVSNEAMRRFDRTDDDLQSLLLHNSIPGPGVLVRKDLFEQVGGYSEEVYYSDWELWIKLLAHGGVPAFVDGGPLVGCRPGAYGDEHDLPRRVELFRSLDENAVAIGGRLREPRIRALVRLQLALQQTQMGSEEEAGQTLVAAFGADPSLSSDPDYVFWWLGPLQRRYLSGAGNEAEVDWLRNLPNVGRAIAAGAEAGHFGCWAVQTATPQLSPRAAETLRWAVTANEIEIAPMRARPRVLVACLVAAAKQPHVIRERWFVKSVLCAAGLWSLLGRARRLRAA